VEKFLNPIEVGELVTLKASINYTGRTSMVVGVRVESENVTSGKKKHCNSSYFTMVAKDDNGKGTLVPGLIIQDEQGIRRFARSKQRKQEMFSRSAKFDETSFKFEEHIEFLKKENAQLKLK